MPCVQRGNFPRCDSREVNNGNSDVIRRPESGGELES